MRNCVFTLLLTFTIKSSTLFAASTASNAFSDAAAYANNSLASARNNIEKFNPGQFQHFTKEPSETKYYQQGESDSTLKNDASSALSNNNDAQIIETTLDKNQAFAVNSNAPEITQSNKVQEDAYNITHSEFPTFCVDGDCYQPNPSQNQNFGKDEAQLAAASGSANSVTQNQKSLRAFSGNSASCSLAPIGFSNCCANKGWGEDIHLASCSTEEKRLAKSKQNGYAIYLGKYCAHKILGVCTQHRESYCVFNGLLAKDVQQQGRFSQLGINFGDTKSPNCSGISVANLQKINFSKIDFSNLQKNLQQQANFPSQSSIQQYIAEKIQQEMGQSEKQKS